MVGWAAAVDGAVPLGRGTAGATAPAPAAPVAPALRGVALGPTAVVFARCSADDEGDSELADAVAEVGVGRPAALLAAAAWSRWAAADAEDWLDVLVDAGPDQGWTATTVIAAATPTAINATFRRIETPELMSVPRICRPCTNCPKRFYRRPTART